MSSNTAIWTYRNDVDPTPAWVGYSVHAFRLIPASSVRSVDHTDETVFVTLTKDHIANAPDCDTNRLTSSHYDEQSSYYGPFL
jgi:hypothetical protein